MISPMKLGATGLEPTEKIPANQPVSKASSAKSGAVGDGHAHLPPELAAVIAAWSTLSEAVQAEILALTKAYSGERRIRDSTQL